MGIKQYLKENPQKLGLVFDFYSRLLGKNKIRGKRGNTLESAGVLMKHCRIYISGEDNHIQIGDLSRLQNCRIYIKGGHNRILIGKNVCLNDTELWIEDNGNELIIGDHTSVDGKAESPVHMAVIEGTRMVLGTDCMLSNGIEIRTGDSHSLVTEDGQRINPSKDVLLGDHVWVGGRVMILKGSHIADNSVVGAGSVVTGVFEEKGCALAGNPAKFLRRGVTWKRERI